MRWPDGGAPGEPDFGDAIDEAIDRIQEPLEIPFGNSAHALTREESLEVLMRADMGVNAWEDASGLHWNEQFLARLEEQGVSLVRAFLNMRAEGDS